MHRAELSVRFDSEQVSLAVWKALVPESWVKLRNVKVDLALSGTLVSIVVETEDESALRATLNSLVKLVYLVLEVLKLGEEVG